MYTVVVKNKILIAHSLPDPYFGQAQNMHGATLEVEAHFSREQLNDKNVVIDIGEAADLLSQILSRFDYRNLDDLPEFQNILTTVEFMAQHIHALLKTALEPGMSLKVVIHESSDATASYEA